MPIPWLGYNTFPLKREFKYELKNKSRSFIRKLTIYEATKNVDLFANGSKDSYVYTTDYIHKTEVKDYVTLHIYEYHVTSMKGNFYLSISTIETIEIPESSNMDTSKLLGLTENITIVKY